MNPKAEILLATYNGEKHLREQLLSLSGQTYPEIDITARDDGSKDNTPSILKEFGIYTLPSDGNAGCIANFSTLLERSRANYLLFCDQDDLWEKEKVEISMQRMLEAEKMHGASTPLLLHTDLKVVDACLNPISPSFWAYSGLKPLNSSFANTLVQNSVTGCSMLMNASLRDLVGKIPPQAKMHDWWIALAAFAFGKVIALPKATLLYRQHETNSIGAKKGGLKGLLQQAFRPDLLQKLKKGREERKEQAEAFFNLYQSSLSDSHKKALEALIQAERSSYLHNCKTAISLNILRASPQRQLLHLLMPNPF